MWQNLKVVELASVLAGPLVGSFFAELGAEVIKIENKPRGGDVTRTWKLAKENSEQKVSAYYASANYGKTSLFMDYTDSDDYAQVIDLIKDADIVLQNFKPGDDVKLGLEATKLLALKPSLIIGCINGFGKKSTRPAFDVVLQAETGFMHMNGHPDGEPVKMPVALIDILAAHHLKEAILIALVEKSLTGKGKIVHVSLLEAAIASLANQANNYLMANHIPQRMGSRHPNIAPYGDLYLTKDKEYIVLAIGNDKQFKLLCNILTIDQKKTEAFSTNNDRVNNRVELNSLLSDKISSFESESLIELFLENKVPFGKIKDIKEVFQGELASKMILKSSIDGVESTSIRTLLT